MPPPSNLTVAADRQATAIAMRSHILGKNTERTCGPDGRAVGEMAASSSLYPAGQAFQLVGTLGEPARGHGVEFVCDRRQAENTRPALPAD